ncbi:hypothetical protein ACEUDB_04750 [Aeromonas hydrophila]|uniref:hypothetical protein n=1 Tax=Aeromonas TaxID=642 RepID=UPI0038CF533E
MKRNLHLEFWNFVCHFGEHKLLDFYNEMVHPAFFEKHTRSHGKTNWFFHEVQFIKVEFKKENLPFVYGKIVKDTSIERNQVFEDDELKAAPLFVPTAPSSIFILSLIDHRLFFIKEHPDSPTMDNFKVTIEKFINTTRKKLINNDYEAHENIRKEHGGSIKKVTKKSLHSRYPEPEIELIPLSSDADIDEFIRSMKTISSLKLKLVLPNSEADTNDFFNSLREETKKVGTNSSDLSFSKNKHATTMPHPKVAKLAKEARKDENIIITLHGTDIHDDKMIGSHEEFTLKKQIDDIKTTPYLLCKQAYETFLELINDGIVRGPKINDLEKIREKLTHIMTSFRR